MLIWYRFVYRTRFGGLCDAHYSAATLFEAAARFARYCGPDRFRAIVRVEPNYAYKGGRESAPWA